MFYPLRLRGITLPNRIVVSAMDMYSSDDGIPGDFHLVHLGSKALGGAGLVMTEMVCVSPAGRITPGCTGLWNDDQRESWRRVVDFVHASTPAKIGIQLGHSGRKGSTKLMWEGMDDPLPSGNWPVVGPSPLPYKPHNQTPRRCHWATWRRSRRSSSPPGGAPSRPGSTCWNCTARTATCCRRSCLR